MVTTLLDPVETTKEDLATLYRARWNNELDIRSLKSATRCESLRCKTPELVRKEVWAHILAYNLLRTVMAQAAARHDVEPRSISFTGSHANLEAFQPLLEFGARRTPQAGCACTTTCSMPSPPTGSATAQTDTSRA